MSETPDLAELEMAFAKDPTKFVALTQAYIQQSRFMEAMVVCKKGIKSQPESTEGRLLLARVYSEQGKIPKAMEELKALLEQRPESAEGHFFYGQMLEKSGKFEEAIESFKEALRRDRGHAGASAALKAKGVDWSPGPSPEEIAAAEAAQKAAEEAEAKRKLEEESRLAEEAWKAQEAQRAAAAAQSQRNGQNGQAVAGPGMQTGMPAKQPRTAPPMAAFPNDPAYQSAAGAYGMFSGPVPVQGAHKRLGPGFTFGLGALLLLIVVGVAVFLKISKDHQAAIKLHWDAAKKDLQSDTTKGYRDGIKELEQALQIDDGEARVVAAYAYALAAVGLERGDKELDTKARDAVKRAAKVADDQPATTAAQMMVLRAEGKPEEALALAKKLGADDTLPVNVRVQLGRTYAALGKVPEMIKVADSMKEMQDTMALTFVGEAYRRVGDHARARQELDGAIKNNLDHDPSRALRALTILEDDDATNLNVAIDDLNTLKELGKDSVGNKQRGYASLGLAVVGDKLGRDHRENEREMANAKTVLGGDAEVPFFEARQIFSDDSPDWNKAIELANAAIKADKVRLAPYLTVVKAASRAKNFAAADKALADAQLVFGDNLELGLAKGIRLRDEGRFDDAIASLKSMMPGHDVAEVYREIGKVYLRMPGEHKADAVDWLKKAAEKAKNRSPATQANVFTELGKAYAAAGDHAQAREIYGNSLATTSEYSVTYYWLAVSLKELKEDGKAKAACQQYVRNEPNGRFKDDCIKLVQ